MNIQGSQLGSGQALQHNIPKFEIPNKHLGSVAQIGNPGLSHAEAFQAKTEVVEQINYSLSLTTKEGDQVSITFNSQEAFSHSQQSQFQQQGNAQSLSSESSSRYTLNEQLQVEVKGHLNQSERDAIDQFMSGLDAAAEQFFAGEDSGTLQQFAQLGVDSGEIASFSLDAQLSQKIERVEAYQAVQSNFATSPARLYAQDPQFQLLTDALKDMQHNLLQQAEQIFDAQSAQHLVQVGVQAELAQRLASQTGSFSPSHNLGFNSGFEDRV